MPTHIDNIEAVIGPSSELIVTDTNRKNLIMWADMMHRARNMPFPPGINAASVLTNVELANLYHAHGPGAKPDVIQGAFADLVRHVERTGFAPVDTDVVSRIVGDAIRVNNEVITDQMGIEIAKFVEAMPGIVTDLLKGHVAPVRIEIVTAGEVRVLEGMHHAATPEIIQIASMGHPIMMVGPAGCGKTTIGEMVSQALNLPFLITSTVFDTHELMGFVDGHGAYHRTPFRDAFEHGGVWVADEIDAWDAAALLAANSALANGYVTFPDGQQPVRRHADFRMIACANTFGKGADRVYIGRNQLDAASLDRFAVVAIDYDRNLEMRLTTNAAWANEVWNVRDKVEEKNIRHVVSTRAIIKGSRALAGGMNIERVRKIYLFKGMSEADRKKVVDGRNQFM